MEYFYSASVMGYGEGRFWHKYYDFPNFKRVTKTLTLNPKIGLPFAIIKKGKTVWNRVGLHNIGLYNWYTKYWSKFSNKMKENTIVSIAGTDHELANMVRILNELTQLAGIELNFSCPNVKDKENIHVPVSDLPIYLKLNHKQDPYNYDIGNIAGIRLNSVPKYFGGVSGEWAQKYNWPLINKWNGDGLNVAGCSATCKEDIKILEDIGCTEIGIGSVILTNPKFVEKLNEI